MDKDALHQCELIQNMIEISISSLQGLRTKCAALSDLTQQEIRTLEVKLTKYICKQLQCKQRVPERQRTQALASYPRLGDWLCTINLRPELIQAVPVKLSLDALLQMSSCQVQDTMRQLGSEPEECSRLTAALSCLKSASGDIREDPGTWISEPPRRDSNTLPPPDRRPSTPATLPRGSILSPHTHARSVSVTVVPCVDDKGHQVYTGGMSDAFPSSPLLFSNSPPSKRRAKHPPRMSPSRKLLQLPFNITLTRSKSHESQLANRIEEPVPNNKGGKKNKLLLNVHINSSSGNGCEDSTRTPGPATAPYTLPGTPTLLEHNLALHRGSPQMMRRDIGLSVTHRFSTKSWLSQTCQVCQKNMMFGVKCKHCKLKCHNKCTKEALPCRISFLPLPQIRRAESVPSDINNQIDRTAELPIQFGTLPKVLTKKDNPPMLSQMDSSSNPSSTTSSTPSSPTPFQQSNPPSINATPPPNSSPGPQGPRDSRFHFPAGGYLQPRQQFIFPDVSSSPYPVGLHSEGYHDTGDTQQLAQSEPPCQGQECGAEEEEYPGDEGNGSKEGREKGHSNGECDGDEIEDLPSYRGRLAGGQWRGPISRKASQTSVYLQEWDIPYEQLELGELIGKGRWGKVHKGRWHGEVAIRLLEIDGNNQDHLKLFKKEVMNYRQTRHENVVLFMGACMAPPHLAIITSFCKGRTLFSVVRDAKNTLDINKTRQIAQEIVKGMGYLHAKGIVHKDLKSKNVFYDTNKVVITDFGLFGMSGVVQEYHKRQENELRLPHGWIYYLAPEIVRRMGTGNHEDRLPFSNAADVYAFGTIWYELQARGWPLTNQPAEATIWQVGSGEGIKKVLAKVSLGKEVTEILSACWSFKLEERPSFTQLTDMLEKLPKLNRRLSHPGHFWKSAEPWVHHHCLRDHCSQGLQSRCPYIYK
ncbi:kinase suppressor of Ras 1 isoform X1 [Oncorhynchus mykiss]|uniref:kinase suppressor of Ras 1 isoform X1 n=2 Tax=Oncorhynchus mykiss TaxID=8022 RepID=UPI000B4F1E2E|nr:kinase suppressor of Ras 1 isoform X1 [Oncorhynchus mykiss]